MESKKCIKKNIKSISGDAVFSSASGTKKP